MQIRLSNYMYTITIDTCDMAAASRWLSEWLPRLHDGSNAAGPLRLELYRSQWDEVRDSRVMNALSPLDKAGARELIAVIAGWAGLDVDEDQAAAAEPE